MLDTLDYSYYFNSRFHPPPPSAAGQWVDLANDPSAAHMLIRLGVSTRADLPAVLASETGGKLRLLALRLSPEEAEKLFAGEAIGNGEVVLYGSSWCPECRRARRLLEEEGVEYREVVVDEDPTAEALILSRSGGRRVVPTLLFDDRLFAFNPDPPLLRRLLPRPQALPAS